ncbi:MAG: adenylate/guanylate cyclase domain-containing protein [Spirochaetaceae bacterium]|nr:adenylate/guanylate cyclase domain-containing protein [Spirochaetaceae bacterium]
MDDYPQAVGLFLAGAVAAALFLFALSISYRIFSHKKEYTSHKFLWLGLSAAIADIALGLCLPLIPVSSPVFTLIGSKIQLLGIIGFEIIAFCVVYLSGHGGRITKERLFPLLAGALFFVPLPAAGRLSAAHILGIFSFLMVSLCVFFIVLSRRGKRRAGGYIFLGGVFFVMGLSSFLPASLPQIFLWALGILVFLGVGSRMFSGPLFNLPRDDVEDTILPEKGHEVSQAITPFIPKEFLSILKKDTVMDLQLGDHIKQEMTIFFSDIRHFTDLSENLTPEESFKFINSYLARIVPVIAENGGFVDKYVGDAIMALFPQEKGADLAVRTAIAIQKKLLEYNFHRASCGYRPLSMGIGLHTGTLMLGVVGVEDRMQNTVISDAVNLASRLESITKVFNVSMAISEETFKKLEDPGSYMYRFIGKVRVKGKLAPVSVFEIFDGINPEMLARKMEANTFFEQGMLNYYQKNFGEALLNFQKVVDLMPEDGASIFYLENCIAKLKLTG